MKVAWPSVGSGGRGQGRAVLDATPVAIVELDHAGVVLEWNRAAEFLLGWAAGRLRGRPLPESILGRAPNLARVAARLQEADGEPVAVQVRCRHRRGRLLEISARAAMSSDRGSNSRSFVFVLVDVTEQRRLERRLQYQVEHDPLTHLPNRTALHARLTETLAVAAERGEHTGLLVIDLDSFKEVNDTLGYACGDQLLTRIGPRVLGSAVRDGDMIARLSGDQFGVLLPGLAGSGNATEVAERVLAALHTPFELNDTSVEIAASIGVAVAPEHGIDATELLRNADTAMHEAKEAAASVTLFAVRPHARPHAFVPGRLGLLGELRRALDQRELVVYFQPKAAIDTLQVCGVEALIRWQHPTRGLLPPSEFIAAAEASGLIRPLTDYVLDVSLGQARSWMDKGIPVQVSVNLSTRNLDDLSLPHRIGTMLARHRVPAELLCLEITETAVMQDLGSALIVLGELSSAGITLSLDDFGTGYSSMTYLQRLPVTELKIDRSFIGALRVGTVNDVLVRSTIELGHGLNLRVVAEGVEDSATVSTLREFGCDVVQGYHYARPMPPAEFDRWLTEQARSEAERGLPPLLAQPPPRSTQPRYLDRVG